MGQGKDVLVDGFPCLVTESLRLGVVRVEYLAGFVHGAGAQAVYAVFGGEFGVKGCLEYGDFYFFHGGF